MATGQVVFQFTVLHDGCSEWSYWDQGIPISPSNLGVPWELLGVEGSNLDQGPPLLPGSSTNLGFEKSSEHCPCSCSNSIVVPGLLSPSGSSYTTLWLHRTSGDSVYPCGFYDPPTFFTLSIPSFPFLGTQGWCLKEPKTLPTNTDLYQAVMLS